MISRNSKEIHKVVTQTVLLIIKQTCKNNHKLEPNQKEMIKA